MCSLLSRVFNIVVIGLGLVSLYGIMNSTFPEFTSSLVQKRDYISWENYECIKTGTKCTLANYIFIPDKIQRCSLDPTFAKFYNCWDYMQNCINYNTYPESMDWDSYMTMWGGGLYNFRRYIDNALYN